MTVGELGTFVGTCVAVSAAIAVVIVVREFFERRAKWGALLRTQSAAPDPAVMDYAEYAQMVEGALRTAQSDLTVLAERLAARTDLMAAEIEHRLEDGAVRVSINKRGVVAICDRDDPKQVVTCLRLIRRASAWAQALLASDPHKEWLKIATGAQAEIDEIKAVAVEQALRGKGDAS